MKISEAKSLVGSCGLYCGLCSKYQSKAPSRCTGCKQGEQHSWCSIWNCCVKKHGYETCTECSDIFNCTIFLRRKVAEWIPAVNNLKQINEAGMDNWLREQVERQTLLEKLLPNYNEGRSMNFYCKICARMPVDLINRAVKNANNTLAGIKKDKSDFKLKAGVLKEEIKILASENNLSLD